ncbi:MAG: hypothetical protein V1898_03600 [Patescibacteria group bacterium]
MRNFLAKLKKIFITKPIYALFAVSIISIGLIFPISSWALDPVAWVADSITVDLARILVWLMYMLFIFIAGQLGTWLTGMMVWASGFTGFTNISVVTETWMVVRDLCNLLFIVMLLIIAFATILQIESYSYKKLLPKLIIVVLLINFSQMICGLAVDAAQVVMLTFVNAYSGAAKQGFYQLFQLKDLVDLGWDKEIDAVSTVAGANGKKNWQNMDYLLAVFASGVMLTLICVIMITIFLTLVARIVFIWTLTILSPLAFVASILPITQKYYQRWLSMFGRYIAVGPLLAFFVWLALFVVVKAGDSGISSQLTIPGSGLVDGPSNLTVTKALEPDVFINFTIGCMMLMIGIKLAQEMSSEISGMVSKIADMPKNAAKWYATRPYALGRWGVGKAWGGVKKEALARASLLNSQIYAKTGIQLNPAKRLEGKLREINEETHLNEVKGEIGGLDHIGRGEGIRGWAGAPGSFWRYSGPLKMWGQKGDQKMQEKLAVRKKELEESENYKKNVQSAADARDRVVNGQEPVKTTAQNNLETLDRKAQLKAMMDSMKKLDGNIDQEKIIGAIKSLGLQDLYMNGNALKDDFLSDLENVDTEREEQRTSIRTADAEIGKAHEQYEKAIEAAKPQELKDINKQMEGLSFVFDPRKMKLLQEHTTKMSDGYKTINDGEIVDMYRSLVRMGKHNEALALYYHAAKVGHGNEILKAEKLPVNGEGLDKMEKKFKDAGLGEQYVRSVMNMASQAAEHNGHNAIARWYTSEHGQIKRISQEEHDLITAIEASKEGIRTNLSNGNHMRWGEYDGQKNWSMQNAMLHMLIRGVDKNVAHSIEHGHTVIGTNLVHSLRKEMVETAALIGAAEKEGNGHVVKILTDIIGADKLAQVRSTQGEKIGQLVQSKLAAVHRIDHRITPDSSHRFGVGIS